MKPTTRATIAAILRETGETEASIAAFLATPAAERAAARIEAPQAISPAPAQAERQPDWTERQAWIDARQQPRPTWARFNEYAGDGLPVNYQKEYNR